MTIDSLLMNLSSFLKDLQELAVTNPSIHIIKLGKLGRRVDLVSDDDNKMMILFLHI